MSALTPDLFVARTVAWLNRTMVRDGAPIDADSELFASGLINSIRVLELIAWTEKLIGREIADVHMRMDNFRTVQRIADVFVSPTGGTDDRG